MALNKVRLGTGENGLPVYHYWQDDPSVPVVITGPITGIATVTHPDGTAFRYDVTPEVIEVFPGHQLLVADAIGQRLEAEGHPRHTDERPFVHTPVAITHDLDTGEPREDFVKAVQDALPAGFDSSPSGVMGKVT